MNYANPELFSVLSKSIPFQFLTSLNQGIAGIYSEAYEMAYTSPVILEPEAEYLMPHNRRAIFETFFRTKAIESGLEAVSQPNIRFTASYSIVRAGNFFITASYVNDSGKFVRPSHFRNKHALLNNFLSQQTIEGFEPQETIEKIEDEIYCILLHGPDKKEKLKPGFMEFAIPNFNNNDWVDVYKFSDVLNSAEQYIKPNVIDTAIPKLKKQRKSGDPS